MPRRDTSVRGLRLGRTLLDAAPAHKDTAAMKQMHRQNGSVCLISRLPAQDMSRPGHRENTIFPVFATLESGEAANLIPITSKEFIPQLHDRLRCAALLNCDLPNRMSKQFIVWHGVLFSTEDSTRKLS